MVNPGNKKTTNVSEGRPGYFLSVMFILLGVPSSLYGFSQYYEYFTTGVMHCVLRSHFNVFGKEALVACGGFLIMGLGSVFVGIYFLRKYLEEIKL